MGKESWKNLNPACILLTNNWFFLKKNNFLHNEKEKDATSLIRKWLQMKRQKIYETTWVYIIYCYFIFPNPILNPKSNPNVNSNPKFDFNPNHSSNGTLTSYK